MTLSRSTSLLGSTTEEQLTQLLATLNSIDQGLQIVGHDWRYLYVNDAVVRQGRTTREALLGKRMQECYAGIESTPLFDVLKRCMTARTAATLENHFAYPDGTKAWFELRIEPAEQGLTIFSIDITARKQLEQRYLHSQKLEAIGRLAGGIAHDFNNLLSVILSYTDLIIPEVSVLKHRQDLIEVRRAGERAAELTQQLLAFGRQQVMQPKLLDLNSILSDLMSVLQRLVGEDIMVRFVPPTQASRVIMDGGLFEQVVMNLIVNARDAMPDGGHLTIELNREVFDAANIREHPDAKLGPHIMMAITDTGVGMDRKTQERIFEPFFTTKEAGRGTGLGLATVFGIVKQAGGTIWVYSEPGRGTTFKLYFPEAPADAQPTLAPAPRQIESVHGSELVLLVEDDDQVRSVTYTILQRAGYHVIAASLPEEALALAEKFSAFDLLLTDVVMPVMSGRQLADRLRSVNPSLKVLYMSGYTESSIVHQRVLEAGVDLLEKPVTPDALLRKVREVLDRPRPAKKTT